MPDTEQLREFAAALRRARAWSLVVVVVVVVWTLLTLITFGLIIRAVEHGGSPGIPFICFSALSICFIWASRSLWKCPSCRAFLGRVSNPKFCPRCGVQLAEESTASSLLLTSNANACSSPRATCPITANLSQISGPEPWTLYFVFSTSVKSSICGLPVGNASGDYFC